MDTAVTIQEDWAAIKLRPRLTGLPMSIWITENEGYPYDIRIKVSPIHGGGGTWQQAVPVAVRPTPWVAAGHLDTADFELVCSWIALNQPIVTALWNGDLDADEVFPLLRKL